MLVTAENSRIAHLRCFEFPLYWISLVHNLLSPPRWLEFDTVKHNLPRVPLLCKGKLQKRMTGAYCLHHCNAVFWDRCWHGEVFRSIWLCFGPWPYSNDEITLHPLSALGGGCFCMEAEGGETEMLGVQCVQVWWHWLGVAVRALIILRINPLGDVDTCTFSFIFVFLTLIVTWLFQTLR